VRCKTMLSHWVVMVLNGNAPCHLQQCKCPDQDLWAPLYISAIKLQTGMENKIAKKKTLSNVGLHMNGEKCFLGFLKNVMHYIMTLKGLGD